MVNAIGFIVSVYFEDADREELEFEYEVVRDDCDELDADAKERVGTWRLYERGLGLGDLDGLELGLRKG